MRPRTIKPSSRRRRRACSRLVLAAISTTADAVATLNPVDDEQGDDRVEVVVIIAVPADLHANMETIPGYFEGERPR